MVIIILYILAVLTFFFWILGWSLWRSYLAFSRFFKAQFQVGMSKRSNLHCKDKVLLLQ